jgi:hypothetical protein
MKFASRLREALIGIAAIWLWPSREGRDGFAVLAMTDRRHRHRYRRRAHELSDNPRRLRAAGRDRRN